jgi:quaternary ammonium compound-resistance protein SugE
MVVGAGMLDIGFALSLKMSDGFSKTPWVVAFTLFAAGSFGLLNLPLRDLPIGTAYAAWTGIGAAGTAVLGMTLLDDDITTARLASTALIIGDVVGLNLGGGE